MMIVTTESIHEERYQVLGLVRGCSAYSKNAVKDIGQAFKSVVRRAQKLLRPHGNGQRHRYRKDGSAGGSPRRRRHHWRQLRDNEHDRRRTGSHRQWHRCEARVSGEGEYRRKKLWIGNDPEHFCVFCAEMGTKIESAFA